jgi:Ni,Fe-hydrogenase I cytochrome b subunit
VTYSSSYLDQQTNRFGRIEHGCWSGISVTVMEYLLSMMRSGKVNVRRHPIADAAMIHPRLVAIVMSALPLVSASVTVVVGLCAVVGPVMNG